VFVLLKPLNSRGPQEVKMPAIKSKAAAVIRILFMIF